MNKNVKILVFCVFAVIFAGFAYFLSDDICYGDDTLTIVSWLFQGGTYNFDSVITSFLPQVFTKYLPLWLNIHPHTFSMTIGAYVRAFDVFLLCFVMSMFMFIGREKTKSLPLVVLFSAFYFCYASANMNFDWANSNQLPNYELDGSFVMLTEYSQHFGQLLSFILGLFYIYLFTNSFAKKELPKNTAAVGFLTFLTALSSMFVNIIVGTILFFSGLYLIAVNGEDSKKLFDENKKTFITLIVSYLAGSAFFAYYPGYFKYFSTDMNFTAILKSFYKTFVLANSFEIAMVLMLAAILYFLALNKSTFIKRTIFVAFAGMVGIFVYFMLFSSLGEKTGTVLTESLVLARLLLMTFIYVLFGACLKEHTSEPKEQKIVSVCFTLVLTAFMLVQIPFVYTTMKLWRVMSKETKVTEYCLEKMYRFYSLRGKTALLPEDSLLKVFKISVFIDDKDVNPDEMITNDTFFKNTPFTIEYYQTFYKNPNIVAYKFINAQKALKILFEEGGMINKDDIEHIDFQKLYDDKFVLHRAIEKSKYDI